MMVESELEEKSSSSVTDISLQVNYFFSSIKPCVKINIETSGRVMFLNLSKMVRENGKIKELFLNHFNIGYFVANIESKFLAFLPVSGFLGVLIYPV